MICSSVQCLIGNGGSCFKLLLNFQVLLPPTSFQTQFKVHLSENLAVFVEEDGNNNVIATIGNQNCPQYKGSGSNSPDFELF